MDTATIKFSFHSDLSYVATLCDSIFRRFLNYYSILAAYINVLTKSYKVNTSLNTDVDVLLSILQAGIDRRVGSTVVDIHGNFKLKGVSNGILKNSKSGWFNIIRCFRIIM